MPARIVTLLLLLAIAVLAWLLWLEAEFVGPQLPAGGAVDGQRGEAAPSVSGGSVESSDPVADAAAETGELQRTEAAAVDGFVIRGRTVKASNQPLGSALVRARAFAGTSRSETPLLDVTLTSDPDGRFAWPIDPPNQMTFLDLRGTGDRVRTYAETFVLAPGDPAPEPFDLWIVPLTAKVTGVVLDPEERPIAGARVGLSARGSGVIVDRDGRFELAVPREAQARICATAAGFVLQRVRVAIDPDTGTGTTEVRMRRANRIRGRVTDPDGRPVAGAMVRTFHTIFTTGCETDADGRFLLDNLDPSLKDHSLFARKQGYVEAKAQVAMSATEAEQDLVLGFGVEVRGTVVGPSGQPLAAASVFLGFSPSAYDRLDATTGLDGQFVFPCVAPGEHTINAERRGFAGLRQQIEVPKPPAAPVIVPLQLEVGHHVGGRAVDANGKPVAGVSIAPRLDREYLDGIRAKTDDEGRFRLEGLPAKGLDLEFYGNGILRHNHPVERVDVDDLEVRLERHGYLAGTVVDGNTGEPIREFSIRFGQPRLHGDERSIGGYSAVWVRGGKTFHDDNGEFRIDEEVKIGAVAALEVTADGYGATIDDHVVAERDPDPKQRVIRLFPGIAIEGLTLDRSTGDPIAGVQLKAFSQGRPLRPHQPNDDVGRPIATSDAAGRFRLQNVGVGKISIAVSHTDWLSTTHGPIDVAPGATVPLQEIRLDRGFEVIVRVRGSDGQPMVGAKVGLPRLGPSALVPSDPEGVARLRRVAPGKQRMTVWVPGGVTFFRSVIVERDAQEVEFVASNGNATLVVFVDAEVAMPAHTQLYITSRGGGSSDQMITPLKAGRNVIEHLPAADLQLQVFGQGSVQGDGRVTTVAGGTVETQLQVRAVQRR
ncbi:MAG: carboxypeptidase-like regulatory domain-containing protein [bacterium]|nr:carboxypeptidase-like regulatory domain-containing protein [bacterium]